jgi:dUTPase
MDPTAFKFVGSHDSINLCYEAKSEEEKKKVTIFSGGIHSTFEVVEDEYHISWNDAQAVDMICKINFQTDLNVQKVIGDHFSFKYKLARDKAVPPTRSKGSDNGFDLTLIEKVNTSGNIITYTTGVIVLPGSGIYFEVVPNCNLLKYGYMYTNNGSIIDHNYKGEILVTLIKIDTGMICEEILTPCNIVQLIPRKWLNVSGNIEN